ncbi:hypothetical protein [Parablautia muri]|nr:hypothetical protein [Parablautia muri]
MAENERQIESRYQKKSGRSKQTRAQVYDIWLTSFFAGNKIDLGDVGNA